MQTAVIMANRKMGQRRAGRFTMPGWKMISYKINTAGTEMAISLLPNAAL
jgi:hypothetical protein